MWSSLRLCPQKASLGLPLALQDFRSQKRFWAFRRVSRISATRAKPGFLVRSKLTEQSVLLFPWFLLLSQAKYPFKCKCYWAFYWAFQRFYPNGKPEKPCISSFTAGVPRKLYIEAITAPISITKKKNDGGSEPLPT